MNMFCKKLWMAALVASGVSNCMYAKYISQSINIYDKKTQQWIKTAMIVDEDGPGDTYVVRYDHESDEFYYQSVLDNRKEVDKKQEKKHKKSTKRSSLKSSSKKREKATDEAESARTE
jgi:hypothetical protein